MHNNRVFAMIQFAGNLMIHRDSYTRPIGKCQISTQCGHKENPKLEGRLSQLVHHHLNLGVEGSTFYS